MRNPAEISSPSTLDSDEDMGSDDEAMEDIAMYEEAQLSPIPITKALPQVTLPLSSTPTLPMDQTSLMEVTSPDSDSSETASRQSTDRESRRRSRSRRRPATEGSTEALVPVGELLKRRLQEENVVASIIVRSFLQDWIVSVSDRSFHRIYFSNFLGIIFYIVRSTTLFIRS